MLLNLGVRGFAKLGYRGGVPMGGNLYNAPQGKVPRLMIRALRDPDGANLDRVQIIKGWLDAKGELHEKIYDVACSDGRSINRKNRCRRPVGNTADIHKATYTNDVGESLLMAYWQDPDFDPGQLAFYYLIAVWKDRDFNPQQAAFYCGRVIEIPTPRWTAYDAKYFGLQPLPISWHTRYDCST